MRAYVIADNQLAIDAGWDMDLLKVEFGELKDLDFDLGLLGFDASDMDQLLDNDVAGEDPPTPEPPAAPKTRTGDLWVLGEHRLLCGDSRSSDDVRRLMGKDKADLVWTDPPYGVSYVGKSAGALRIQNDDDAGLDGLLRGSLGNALDACHPGAVWYVMAPPGPNFLPFAQCLTDLGVWRQTLVWVKSAFVLGHSDYHYRHEAIFYGWKPGDHVAPGSRDLDTVWEIDRPKASPDHPTTKPVELVTRALLTSSRPGALVLDPFCGSGTVLLGAESTGRKARAIEIDPAYVDVAILRWQKMTSEEAILEATGETFDTLEAREPAATV